MWHSAYACLLRGWKRCEEKGPSQSFCIADRLETPRGGRGGIFPQRQTAYISATTDFLNSTVTGRCKMSQTGSLEGDILSYINSNLETDDAAVRGNLLNKIAEMGVDLTEGGRLAALRSLVLTNGPSTRSSRITSTELKTKQPPFLDLSQFGRLLPSH